MVDTWVNKSASRSRQASPPTDTSHQGGGLDPILGQKRDGKREFYIVVLSEKGKSMVVRLATETDCVHPTGRGYFFAPSLAALKGMLTE